MSDDNDVAVIALWIIAIGFVILAIDKTTKLNNSPEPPDLTKQADLLLPSVPQTASQQSTLPNASITAEDEQFLQIQKQLQQLGSGIHDLKKKLNPRNG